jgi:uncharacterized protein (TIGR01244 family)
MSKRQLFLLSMLVTIGVSLTYYYFNRPGRFPAPQLVPITEGVFVTSQLKPENVSALRREGIATVIDIRPDGEAANQPSSSQIGTASRRARMRFHYIPVPHESIPEKAVAELDKALSEQAKPVVLYCRTGRRAVRLFALVQASRSDGPESGEILQMVRNAGFSADDLKEEIAQRLSHRHAPQVTHD